ncbi:XopAH/AvrB family type III secretion system effector, partial [Xanthomonas sp. WHRI 8356]
SRPWEKVTVELKHRRPHQALAPEERISSDVQLQVLYTEEQGEHTLHIESSRFHEPRHQSLTEWSQTLLREAAFAALAPGMQGLNHSITSVSPPIRRSLPGPATECSLSPAQVALTGVARWPDPRVNQESTPENQEYGRRFYATAREGGERIASGQIQTFRQLWDFSGAARHSWATQQNPQAEGPGQTKGNAQPFAAGYPRQKNVSTPLTKHYAYLRPRVRQLPLIRQANDLVAKSEQALPKTFMAHDVFEMVGVLNGAMIPLTQLKLAVNPDDFYHSLAQQGRKGNGLQVEGSAFPFVIEHTPFGMVQPIMNHVETLFSNLIAQRHDPASLMPTLGSLHWWMAHAMPDSRGSAAKTELAVRALAHAHGIELPPFAHGIAADLEAFVTDRESFSSRYADFFELPEQA